MGKLSKKVEKLEDTVSTIKQKLNWIKTDISYKAPEQLTVDLLASYLDMIRQAITEKDDEDN